MSLWWAKRDDLDKKQLQLIDDLPLTQNHLVTGPPGSGKTNILLRRAQFVRSQDMPRVLVLTFTRSLTEFVKTGCFDAEGREIFPQASVSTLESWIRRLYKTHGVSLPPRPTSKRDYSIWKRQLAQGALDFKKHSSQPPFDAIFVDEVQDLYDEEVQLIRQWANTLFFTGDERQKLFENTNGLVPARKLVSGHETALEWHYRVAPEICEMADRILVAPGTKGMSANCHYKGPKPASIEVASPASKAQQLEECTKRLRDQIRVYEDRLRQGDRLGVIVARKDDRDLVFSHLERDEELQGKSKVIRAWDPDEDDDYYSPEFDADRPINIVTVQGCKGLEFRAVHWLFADDLMRYHTPEHYYTVVTRAKTSLDIRFTSVVPQEIAGSYSKKTKPDW
ncbi:hypothetical protein C3942_14725 [Solimonas fluminis]|uniref:DNA helicase n=1 Tax=Solimonas fluminis TaxID=2086571 RepID=A0A2S5TDM0_9GAMM|nr:AAA family ATPase [Solimonas fluminis]PPE73076.1 hypothetical protein C3942_14725 [Solimonas fluminis]